MGSSVNLKYSHDIHASSVQSAITVNITSFTCTIYLLRWTYINVMVIFQFYFGVGSNVYLKYNHDTYISSRCYSLNCKVSWRLFEQTLDECSCRTCRHFLISLLCPLRVYVTLCTEDCRPYCSIFRVQGKLCRKIWFIDCSRGWYERPSKGKNRSTVMLNGL